MKRVRSILLILILSHSLPACRSKPALLSEYDLFSEGHASWKKNLLKGELVETVLRSLGLHFAKLRPVCFTPGKLVAFSYERTTGDEKQRVYLWLGDNDIRTSFKRDWKWDEVRQVRLAGVSVMRLDKDGGEHSPYVEKLRRQFDQGILK